MPCIDENYFRYVPIRQRDLTATDLERARRLLAKTVNPPTARKGPAKEKGIFSNRPPTIA